MDEQLHLTRMVKQDRNYGKFGSIIDDSGKETIWEDDLRKQRLTKNCDFGF